jgi:glutamyl-tRNA reductase
MKYTKAKKCLEGTFQQLRELRRVEAEQPELSVAEEVDEILEGVEARECHNFIRDTN